MAFNFLGTIVGIEQFEEFEEFITVEASKMERKIDHLQKQKMRYYEILDKFKEADQHLRREYPLSERADIDYIKNPRSSIPTPPLTFDSLNALDVDTLKKFTLDSIKHKKENNEFKIKKIRDKIEQLDNDIKFYETNLDTYEETLNNIRTRFGLPDFAENQEVADLDPKDVDPNIPVTRRDAGRQVIDGVTYYLPLNIRSFNKSITFDTSAPTLKPNQLINLSNGLNNGTYTVSRILSSTTIQVYEDLVDEDISTTRVAVI